MEDFLVRGILPGIELRFAWAGTAKLCARGIRVHDLDPLAAAAFCDAAGAAATLAVLLDPGEKYSLRWVYPGAVQGLLLDVNAAADVRGRVANPHPAAAGARNAADLYGDEPGTVSAVKSEAGKILNSGEIQAGMARPSADLAMFFSISDQIETEIATAVRFRPDPENPVAAAGGFLLQALPSCNLEKFSAVREILHEPEFARVLTSDDAPFEKRLRSLLGMIAPETARDARYEPGPIPGYRCACSRATMKRAMLTLGESGLEDLFKSNPAPRVRCEFCGKNYEFRREEFFGPGAEDGKK